MSCKQNEYRRAQEEASQPSIPEFGTETIVPDLNDLDATGRLAIERVLQLEKDGPPSDWLHEF